jgi:hypothetical protein
MHEQHWVTLDISITAVIIIYPQQHHQQSWQCQDPMCLYMVVVTPSYSVVAHTHVEFLQREEGRVDKQDPLWIASGLRDCKWEEIDLNTFRDDSATQRFYYVLGVRTIIRRSLLLIHRICF